MGGEWNLSQNLKGGSDKISAVLIGTRPQVLFIVRDGMAERYMHVRDGRQCGRMDGEVRSWSSSDGSDPSRDIAKENSRTSLNHPYLSESIMGALDA